MDAKDLHNDIRFIDDETLYSYCGVLYLKNGNSFSFEYEVYPIPPYKNIDYQDSKLFILFQEDILTHLSYSADKLDSLIESSGGIDIKRTLKNCYDSMNYFDDMHITEF